MISRRRETLAHHVNAWQHRRNTARTKAEWRFTAAARQGLHMKSVR
jgi:hypothetical protein